MHPSNSTTDNGKVIMFTGKGGVGKTTCAAATALHYASCGETTLVLSTDPTPSLSHIFENTDKQKPKQVAENLYLQEVGLNEVKQMWDKKFGREVYEVFSTLVSVSYEDFVDFITSILPGLADEFMVDYLKGLFQQKRYARIVWDTAPLGQTLGLLQTPAMLSQHLKPAPRIYSRLKFSSETRRSVLDIIKEWEKLSGQDMDFLRKDVSFTLVTIPEALAVEQLESIMGEFDKLEGRIERLVINNVVQDTSSAFLMTKAEMQKPYIELIRQRYQGMEITEIPLLPSEIKGIDALQHIAQNLFR